MPYTPCPVEWCAQREHPVGHLHTPGKHRADVPVSTLESPYFPLHRADGYAR